MDAEKNLMSVAKLLRSLWPHIRFSSVYRTAPRDFEDQAEFLNAVARIETEMTAEEIHNEIQKIEKLLGKNITIPKGPRTIDLDLLLIDDHIVPDWDTWQEAHRFIDKSKDWNDQSMLYVPHSRMHERRFVLEPLCALMDPESKHPLLQKTWNALLEETKVQRCELMQLIL